MRDADATAARRGPTNRGPGGQATSGRRRFTNLVVLGRVDSTNRYLRDLALAGGAEGLAVVADEQLAGRGRRGRQWVAPAGGALLLSVLLRPAFGREELHLLPSALGLAALDALRATCGLPAALKWPNDVVVGGKKLAGILAEVVEVDGPEAPAVVAGIGVNLSWPDGWPPDDAGLGEIAARATTVERASGLVVGRDELAEALLDALDERYEVLATPAGRSAATAAYRRACATIGQEVELDLGDRVVRGVALDVADDGRLLVEHGGAVERFEVGDVVHLRGGPRPVPAPGARPEPG